MNTHHLTPRPARLAIAAFLAFGSTSVLAQEAVTAPPPAVAPTTPPAVQASPVTVAPPAMPVAAPATPAPATSAPATSAPATPAFASSAPVVQATPSVEQNKAQAIAASQADAVRPVERAAPAVTAKRVVEKSQPRTAPPVERAVPNVPAPVEQTVPSQPVAPVATAEPATAQPAPQPTMVQSTNPALFWALGGGVLILAGLGGTALMRRRRRDELDQPVRMTEPAMVEPASLTAPQPVRAAPVPVAARAMTAEQRTLEEMVAAPPSPANPFLTHAKRLRRARFLLEQHNAAPMARENVAAPLSATAHPVDRSQTVYSFGKGDMARATFLKPRTR